MIEWGCWTWPYDLLVLRPNTLKKEKKKDNCHGGVWIEIKIEMKYEMKRKYEIMNVKVKVN